MVKAHIKEMMSLILSEYSQKISEFECMQPIYIGAHLLFRFLLLTKRYKWYIHVYINDCLKKGRIYLNSNPDHLQK